MNQLFALIVCAAFLSEACTPRSANTADPSTCIRPYADNSIWNVPLDWKIAKIHPQNDQMMQAFFESSDWIGTDAAQYAATVYFVTNHTPPVPVKLRSYSFRDAISDMRIEMGQRGGTVMMPLPEHAEPAPGTDAQMVVINLDTGEEWGLNKGENRGGVWFAGGAYRYDVHKSGVPPVGFSQRGAGIGQFAGIVRACEIERGHIDHAVTLAYDYPCAPEVCKSNGWPEVIPPFTKTDGEGRSRYDIPEGARIVIRPTIPRKEIEKACGGIKGCVIWAINMQEYGAFVVDRSGHPKAYAEGDATAHWDPKVWTKDMLQNIPSDWYAVIDWNYPSTSGTN
jgi:hypothetical protein